MREGHFVWNNCRLARKSAATRRWLERTGLRRSCKTVLSWKIIINYFDQSTKLESCSCKTFANSTYHSMSVHLWKRRDLYLTASLCLFSKWSERYFNIGYDHNGMTFDLNCLSPCIFEKVNESISSCNPLPLATWTIITRMTNLKKKTRTNIKNNRTNTKINRMTNMKGKKGKI